MKISRIFVKRTMHIAIVAETALCLSLITYFTLRTLYRSETPLATSNSSQKQAEHTPGKITAELPRRLQIPKLKIDAALEHVGLTAEGEMAVPKSAENAAWFNAGPRPGERGSSVIAGHFGLKNNVSAVFDNLHLLRTGDNLYIEDEKGATITFVVRESRTFTPNEDASSVFTSSDGKAHLNLVTCRGVWDKIQKSYSTRLVVFADRVAPR